MFITARQAIPASLLLLCICWAAPVPADIYKYTDANGVVSITDNLGSVPKRYRSSMIVIKEAKKEPRKNSVDTRGAEEATPSEDKAPAALPQPSAAEKSYFFAGHSWSKPLIFGVGLLAAFLAAIKIAGHLGSSQLAKVIYLAFFLGVAVFLYKVYTDHLVEGTLTMKKKTIEMFKKASVREAPTAEEKAPEATK